MCVYVIYILGQIFNTVIQQRCIELIKSDSKDIYDVAKDFYFK